MSWAFFLAFVGAGGLQANAAPRPVLAASESGDAASPYSPGWRQRAIERLHIGPSPAREFSPPAIWERPQPQVGYCWNYSCWGGESGWYPFYQYRPYNQFLFFPEVQRSIRHALAVAASDLGGIARGREVAKLVRKDMDREVVSLFLREASEAMYWCHDHGRLCSRVVCLDLGLSVCFSVEGTVESVRTDLVDLTANLTENEPAPPPPAQETQVFTFFLGWSQ